MRALLRRRSEYGRLLPEVLIEIDSFRRQFEDKWFELAVPFHVFVPGPNNSERIETLPAGTPAYVSTAIIEAHPGNDGKPRPRKILIGLEIANCRLDVIWTPSDPLTGDYLRDAAPGERVPITHMISYPVRNLEGHVARRKRS